MPREGASEYLKHRYFRNFIARARQTVGGAIIRTLLLVIVVAVSLLVHRGFLECSDDRAIRTICGCFGRKRIAAVHRSFEISPDRHKKWCCILRRQPRYILALSVCCLVRVDLEDCRSSEPLQS
jgi:hypothetical protein